MKMLESIENYPFKTVLILSEFQIDSVFSSQIQSIFIFHKKNKIPGKINSFIIFDN
jgi:hypothetical protein